MSAVRKEIARLAGQGLPDRRIAELLGIARTTVEYHRRRLAVGDEPARGSSVPAVVPGARGQVRTRERVRELLEAGVGRAEIARRLGIGKGTVSYHARRLGAGVDERCARRYDWDEIQSFYDQGRTVEECVSAFGFSRQTWHAAKQRGDLVTRPVRMPLEELLVAGRMRSRGYVKRRLMEADLKREACEACGVSEWRGNRLSLDLHHVNGDRLDNRLENLALLCPNCHSLADAEVRQAAACSAQSRCSRQ